MGERHKLPQGEMVLRTLAMPADTNANGDIFGGWLMSQMDMGGAILAKEIAEGRVVTVRVDGMSFSQAGRGRRCGELPRALHPHRQQLNDHQCRSVDQKGFIGTYRSDLLRHRSGVYLCRRG